jgi:hypothetical protein
VSVSLSRRWGAGAVLIVAAAALSGCGPIEAGSAAIVGDRRISARELEQATADINAFTGPDQPVSAQQILFDLIVEPYALERAGKAETGALVSEAQAREVLKQRLADPSQAAIDVLRVNASIAQVQQTQAAQAWAAGVRDDLKKATVTVNPRYGSFDPNQVEAILKEQTIPPASRNWLPATTPTPTPAAGGGDGAEGGATQPSP